MIEHYYPTYGISPFGYEVLDDRMTVRGPGSPGCRACITTTMVAQCCTVPSAMITMVILPGPASWDCHRGDTTGIREAHDFFFFSRRPASGHASSKFLCAPKSLQTKPADGARSFELKGASQPRNLWASCDFKGRTQEPVCGGDFKMAWARECIASQ